MLTFKESTIASDRLEEFSPTLYPKSHVVIGASTDTEELEGARRNVCNYYLGRYNGIYQAPRETVAAVTGEAPTKMKRNYERSFCCGAGGGRMWLEENIGKRISDDRVEEALKENPRTICVCCPYCMTMFEDGLKDKGADDGVQVLDLAEIVAGALK